MKNLKLEIQVLLIEEQSGKISTTTIANSHHHRVIDSELRSKLTHEELKHVINREIFFGTEFIVKDIDKQIILPLTMDIEKQIEVHLKALEVLFPDIHIGCYHDEGKFVLYSFCKKPDINRSKDPDYHAFPTTDIVHPLDPYKRYLTTKYDNMYQKLKDETWSYNYQCNYYYEGIVERVLPPIDESKIEQYFKEAGVNYEIHTQIVLPLPEVGPYEPEENDDRY